MALNQTVKIFLLALTLFVSALQLNMQFAHAVIEAVEFENPALLKRYQSLIAELRCLVCQNQNLADSDADLAKDLRRKTEEMLKAGQSDEEILGYMRERYGDFVLYSPPLNATTSFLWIGPFILLAIALISVFTFVKRKQTNTLSTQTENNTGLARVRKLLNDATNEEEKYKS